MLPVIQKILYATDLSDGNGPVYRMAMSLAVRHQAALTVLHVLEPIPPFAQALIEGQVEIETLQRIQNDGLAKVRERIEQQVATFCRDEVDDRAQADARIADILVREGVASRVILDTADEIGADLVVLGAHGRSTIGELLIGSTAHKVSQRSRRPVLLVPAPED